MHKVIAVLGSVFLFVGCQSSQRTVVPGVGDGIVETRSAIGDLGEGQTELALTGGRIENDSTALAEGIEVLERAIGGGAGNDEEFAAILRAIRERAIAEGE